MTRPISELFGVLVEWALAQDNAAPGTMSENWRSETDEWLVLFNGSAAERDNVPPFTFLLNHRTALVGMALVSPYGGAVSGVTEGELIEYFRALTPAQIGGAA